jgi:DNA repair photolyase
LKQLFEDWLEQHFPDRARRVLELIRETRAGTLNDAKFGRRFTGTGVYADLLARRFERAARQYRLDADQRLDCSLFTVPADTRGRTEAAQLSLF